MTQESSVEIVLLPEDDAMHPVEDVSNFNESAYYNFFDRTTRTGGWVRIGNRPNEGYAEMTVCFYEPDGSAAFMWKKPEMHDNRAHDAGGLRFEVVERWKEHRVTYRGGACVMKNPLEIADPRAAFRDNPHQKVDLDVRWLGLSPGWGGEPRRRRPDGTYESAAKGDPKSQFARGHFEQHGAAKGKLKIGDREYSIDGYGLRDHSWGPRYWQNTGYYRWLTMNFGEDLGLMGLVSERSGGREASHGYVYERGKPNATIAKVELETDFGSEQKVHERLRIRLHRADGGAPIEVTGRVLSLVPCRNRREGWVTRVSEGMTEWQLGGRVGYGMSEYLDHLQKGEA
jgi:hypothetical protein